MLASGLNSKLYGVTSFFDICKSTFANDVGSHYKVLHTNGDLETVGNP
jgi:hypothetical protein